jgi:hypothetical protein
MDLLIGVSVSQLVSARVVACFLSPRAVIYDFSLMCRGVDWVGARSMAKELSALDGSGGSHHVSPPRLGLGTCVRARVGWIVRYVGRYVQ